MKNIIILLFIAFGIANSTTYYVSTSGDDANAGTSQASPWKNLSRIHNTAYSPGDSILLKRGDVFEGQIVDTLAGTSGSPIVIGAYGTGAKPILYGDFRGIVWTKIAGRTGYYKAYTNGYSEVLTGFYQWVGASWVQSDGAHYRGSSSATWEAFLDGLGEGSYGVNIERDTLFIHTFGSVTFPATRDSIRVYRYANKITTGSHHYIVRDLDIRNYQVPFIANLSDNAIARCLNTVNGYSSGIRFIQTTNSTVDSCVVDSSGDSGIYLVNSHKAKVRYNTVKNVLLSNDGGISGGIDLCGVGILDNYLYGRTQDTVGYNTVEYNAFDNILRGFTDWYYCIGDTVRYNVGHNGASAGSPVGKNLVMTNNNFTFSSVTGGNGPNMGMYEAGNITFTNNVLDSVKDYGIWTSENLAGGTFTINHNTIRMIIPSRSFVDYKTVGGITSTENSFYGTGNTFARAGVYYPTLSAFQSATGFEAGSTLNLSNGEFISVYSGAAQSSPVKSTLAAYSVIVYDSSNYPISGVPVTFARASSPSGSTGQSITVTTDTTDEFGIASTVLALGSKIGAYTVTATSAGLTGSPLTFTSTAYNTFTVGPVLFSKQATVPDKASAAHLGLRNDGYLPTEFYGGTATAWDWTEKKLPAVGGARATE
jgi:parallel beta-helix repeat protein